MFRIILQSISLCNRLEKNVHCSLTIPNIHYKYFGNSVLLRTSTRKTLKNLAFGDSEGYKSLGIILNSNHMISKIHAYFYS